MNARITLTIAKLFLITEYLLGSRHSVEQHKWLIPIYSGLQFKEGEVLQTWDRTSSNCGALVRIAARTRSFWLSQMEACRKERPPLLSHANITGAPDTILGVINDGDTGGTFAHHSPSPEISAPGPVVNRILCEERN